MTTKPAAIIGSGPNGLAAAVTLARAGIDVTVFESADTIGGGTRTDHTVSSSVLHDVCSAIHPMALASPFFQAFELDKRVRFETPDVSYAHPLDSRPAVLAHRDIALMREELGQDGPAYLKLMQPLLDNLDAATDFALGGSMLRVPNIIGALTVGARTLELGTLAGRLRYREEAAPALFAGVAAHSIGHSPSLSAAAVGVMLALCAHARGWPVPVGGSRAITQSMATDLVRHGGVIRTSHEITDIRELDEYAVAIFTTSPRALAHIAGKRLPQKYQKALEKFRYGAGVSKVDFVLDGPVPWRDERMSETATVHVGGTRKEIAVAENSVLRGSHPTRPYVLVAQPDGFDTQRNTGPHRALWSYTHVPRGSDVDISERVITQIERFAPHFRDRIVDSRVTTASEYAQYNSNYIGGDINVGAVSLKQLIARPVFSPTPWRTPARGIYLASSATPPGPGVHGLSGFFAARDALSEHYNLAVPDLSYSAL